MLRSYLWLVIWSFGGPLLAQSWHEVPSRRSYQRLLPQTAVTRDGIVYLFRGTYDAKTDVWVDTWNPAEDRWTSAPSIPFQFGFVSVAAARDGKIYLIGSTTASGQAATGISVSVS